MGDGPVSVENITPEAHVHTNYAHVYDWLLRIPSLGSHDGQGFSAV